MNEAQNQQLDAVVEEFLGLVSSKLLLKPALKAVEWLVRKFRSVKHTKSLPRYMARRRQLLIG